MDARQQVKIIPYHLLFILHLVNGQPTTKTFNGSCATIQRANNLDHKLDQILKHLQKLDIKVNDFEEKLGELERIINHKTEKSIGPVEVVANFSSFYGAWMKDVAFPDSQKVYVIRHHDYIVRQYADISSLENGTYEKDYSLRTYISGSGMVYNGSVYYNEQHTTTVYQYNMATGQSKTLVLTGAGYHAYCEYQYGNGGDETAIDIEVDERGLWFIYGLYPNNNCQFSIAKIDPVRFTVERNWTLPWSRSKQTTGEAFVKGGKLYIIDSATNQPTYVAYVFDTETGQGRSLGSTKIVYPNTYPNTWFMSYNINDNNLYVWHRNISDGRNSAVRYHVTID